MRFRLLACALGLWCAACGGDDDASTPPTDAGVGGSGGGSGSSGSGGGSGSTGSGGTSGSAGSAGNGGSSGAGGSGGSGGSGAVFGDGFVLVQQSAAEHRLLSIFDVWTPMPLCSFREMGPCRIDLCTPATTQVSAGQIGASVGMVTRTVTSTDGGAPGASWPGLLWQPGETVRLFAAGAEVPAFEESVPGPGPFTLIEPVPSTTVPVSRTQPLRVRWSGGDFGSAVVAFSGTSPTAQTLQVKCSFNAALGEASVPTEALSDFDPAQRITLVSFAEGYKRLDRGGWLLRVAARTQSVSATVALQ